MHTHRLWVRLARVSVAVSVSPLFFPPLFFFAFLPDSSSLVPRIFHSSSHSRRQESPSPSAHTSLNPERSEIHAARKGTRAHRHPHTRSHTPSQTSRVSSHVEDKSSPPRVVLRGTKSLGQIVFLLFVSVRALLLLSVGHTDELSPTEQLAVRPAIARSAHCMRCSCALHLPQATAALLAGCAPELVAGVPRHRRSRGGQTRAGHWSVSRTHCAMLVD